MTAIESSHQLRPAIAIFLRQYARRQHALTLLGAVAQAFTAAIIWFVMWGVIDRFIVTI